MLRFSRIFGPGKVSSLPQLWRSARKRAHKHRRRQREQNRDQTSDSGSEGEGADRRRHKGWTLNFAPPPNAELCISDDEVRVHIS